MKLPKILTMIYENINKSEIKLELYIPPEIIYFSGKKETETENHLYSIKFNGSRLKRLSFVRS